MHSLEQPHQVCLVLDFEGFCKVQGAHGNIKYKMPMLLTHSRLTVAYVTGCMHGLMFQDDPTEHAKPQNCLQTDLQLLYESNKTPEQ